MKPGNRFTVYRRLKYDFRNSTATCYHACGGPSQGLGAGVKARLPLGSKTYLLAKVNQNAHINVEK